MKVVGLGVLLAACGSSEMLAPDAAPAVDTAPLDTQAVDSPPFGAFETYLKAATGDEGDRFGFSLSLSGDGQTLAVGAFNEDSAAVGIDGDALDNTAPDSGAVFVYRRAGDAWEPEAYLKASNARASSQFGSQVRLAADGDTLAISAPAEPGCGMGIDNPGQDSCGGAGAVYVFARTAGTWAQQAYVKPSNTRQGNFFGQALAVSADGTTLAVGQVGDPSNSTNINGDASNTLSDDSGAVFVFARDGATWSQQAYVKTSNAEQRDGFGASVALSANGDVLAAGAPAEDGGIAGVGGSQLDNSVRDAGAVYLFSRASGIWTQDFYVKASNPHQDYAFGSDVALSGPGTTLAVASFGESSGATGVDGDQTDTSELQAGAVYAFGRIGDDWVQQAYLKEDVSNNGDQFGSSISLSSSGDVLAVGAVNERRTPPPMQVGGVYAFRRSGSTWARELHAFASNGDVSDLFGWSVSLAADGTTIAASAPEEDGRPDQPAINDRPASGAVYVIR